MITCGCFVSTTGMIVRDDGCHEIKCSKLQMCVAEYRENGECGHTHVCQFHSHDFDIEHLCQCGMSW